MSNLQMLNLSSNKLKSLLPSEFPLSSWSKFALRGLLSLNLSDNPLADIKTTANTILVLMPEITDLQINIYSEGDVEYLI